MKALDIWQQDILDREAGSPLPRQQYYTALRDALHRELMQQGYCDWLEQLLLEIRGGTDRIYVVDYAALMECHSMIVLGREMRDATDFVPHLHLRGEKARWEVLDQPDAFLMPLRSDIVEKLRQLRAVSRQLVEARDSTVLPQADDAAQREIEQVHTLNKMLDDRCKTLQQERDELAQRLRLLEEGVITEQVGFAIEARRIQEEEALRRSYEAQQLAAREAFRSQFAEEQEAAQLRLEEEAQSLSALRQETAGDYADARSAMAGDLRQLASLLETKINAWDGLLQRTECRMLAQSYVSLHALSEHALNSLALEAAATGAAETVLAAVADVQQQFRDRVRQLETAMNRLGLVILRPAAGESYNPAYHLAQDPAPGKTVSRCIQPGVAAQGAQEAILRAEVELQ